MANKALDWFVMGLCFGIGFLLSQAMLHAVTGFLSKA